MTETVIFLILTAGTAAMAAAAVLRLAKYALLKIRKKPAAKPLESFKKSAALSLTGMALAAVLVAFTQGTATTPAITDGAGRVAPDGISELIAVSLNGKKQWISIRGYDKNKPVLLFLAGGPGGSQLAAVRRELPELERYFVVVGWDQPGSAKSYGAVKQATLTPETYIEDGLALTQYLKERFSKEKIYLIGESWGSALGIFLAARDPASYAGFIGTGQMVDFTETERMDYAHALSLALEAGDQKTAQKLLKNGEPPYYGKGVALRSAVYLNYLGARMARDPDISNPGYDTLRDILSPEYELLDKINYVRGIITTYGRVYPQLCGIDLRRDYTALAVPAYFFLGQGDLNAPLPLATQYFEVLTAPKKELVWFEHSGHSPWINEPDRFTKEVLRCFLEDGAQENTPQ